MNFLSKLENPNSSNPAEKTPKNTNPQKTIIP